MSENKLSKDMEVKEVKEKKSIDECKNAVDLLLSIDADEVKMPSDTYDMYCEKVKMRIPFECFAIDPEYFEELQSSGVEMKKNKIKDIDGFKMKANIILACCPLFKDEDIKKKFKAPTPKELLRKLLLAGEINELYDFISELNGYGEEDNKDKKLHDEIKN